MADVYLSAVLMSRDTKRSFCSAALRSDVQVLEPQRWRCELSIIAYIDAVYRNVYC